MSTAVTKDVVLKNVMDRAFVPQGNATMLTEIGAEPEAHDAGEGPLHTVSETDRVAAFWNWVLKLDPVPESG